MGSIRVSSPHWLTTPSATTPSPVPPNRDPPRAELTDATRVAEEIGIRHETVEFSELDSEEFMPNDDTRCYHCRSMRLGAMYDRARELGIDVVCDGTNASDTGEGHRPGLRAVEELDAYSPLLEHDIEKAEVRAIADEYDLSVADKPSMACLSSRIPTGLEVTEERLSRVERPSDSSGRGASSSSACATTTASPASRSAERTRPRSTPTSSAPPATTSRTRLRPRDARPPRVRTGSVTTGV